MSARAVAVLAALALAGCAESGGGPSGPSPRSEGGPPTPRLVRVGTFEMPTFVAAPPGDRERIFVVERTGRVRVLRDGRPVPQPFLDVSPDVSSDGERGLLSMAFAPDYARSGRVYVYLTDREGDIRVEEFQRDARNEDRADPASRRLVLEEPHREFSNHNGGQLAFGPDDMLYLATGDGGGGGDPLENAQDLGSRLGKLLRIDPSAPAAGRPYGVPEGNPFAGRAGARPEIYALGLRNPFRFSFDRQTGDLAIADNGQEELEEVDFQPRGRGAGANYGWSVFEAGRRYGDGTLSGDVKPVLEQPHPEFCSIIGGYVVRDPELAGLEGRYVYGDFCSGELRTARLAEGGAEGDAALGVRVSSLSSFGEDGRGRVYATSLEGDVFRLAPG